MSENVILIDAAGWGDLILGVVIGALNLNLPDPRYMERRVPISSFQPPNFENKTFMDDTVRIVDKIVQVMQPDKATTFKVSSGYVLSGICRHLRDQGFKVEEVDATGELQEKVDRGYIRWCKELGVPAGRLAAEHRFWPLLEWVAERPRLRVQLVKTGWNSWKEKWRERAALKGDIVR
jgi:hypothetical protein